MKLDIKKDMYIRTKDGIIDKVIFDYNGHCAGRNCDCNHISCVQNYYEEDAVIKASFDIIDLLEEWDLVEIEYYSSQSKERVTRLFEVDYKYGKSLNLMNSHFQFLILDGKFSKKSEEFEPVIRMVTTKEQIEQISYRVGEEI